jgi:hypothetical protein
MHGPWNVASYLDGVKAQLGIASAQEGAWNDYAGTVKGAGEQMQAVHQVMFDAMPTASWDERRAMMNEMFQSRQQAFDDIHAAALKLLPSLDAKQQATARTILPGLAPGRGHRGPHGPR